MLSLKAFTSCKRTVPTRLDKQSLAGLNEFDNLVGLSGPWTASVVRLCSASTLHARRARQTPGLVKPKCALNTPAHRFAAPLAAEAQRSALMTGSVGPIADLTIEFHIAGGVVLGESRASWR